MYCFSVHVKTRIKAVKENLSVITAGQLADFAVDFFSREPAT